MVRSADDHVPEAARRLNDIAFSGNGEPTSASCLPMRWNWLVRCCEFGLQEQIKLVLISNGSLIGKPAVRDGLRRPAARRRDMVLLMAVALPIWRR